MKRNDKQRLFEVMSRLDKTFKPKLNEEFDVESTDEPEMGIEEIPAEEQEKSPEEKLQELTAKVDELYALLHGEETEEDDVEGIENLQEWNFDKKKGDKKEEKEEKPKGKTQFNFDKKDKETSEDEDEPKEKEELDEAKPKVPVAAIAKVGK